MFFFVINYIYVFISETIYFYHSFSSSKDTFWKGFITFKAFFHVLEIVYIACLEFKPPYL